MINVALSTLAICWQVVSIDEANEERREIASETRQQLDDATNKLPDRHDLIELIMDWEGTDAGKKVLALKEVPFCVLRKFVKSHPPTNPRFKPGGLAVKKVSFAALVDEAIDSKKPQKSLISLILEAYDTDNDGMITESEFAAILGFGEWSLADSMADIEEPVTVEPATNFNTLNPLQEESTEDEADNPTVMVKDS